MTASVSTPNTNLKQVAKVLALSAALVAAYAGISHAGEANGYTNVSDILDVCAMSDVFCAGYTDAIAEVGVLTGSVCTPNGNTPKQVAAVVTKIMRQNPERWTDPAATATLAILKATWPCEQPKGKHTS